MSSVLLAIFTYPGGNAALARHWDYFMNQKADRVYAITTTEGACQVPLGATPIGIGGDCYIEGPHLPNRMLDTIERLLKGPWRILCLCEYDCVLFKPLPFEQVKTIAAYRAGGKTWGSKASAYYHNPWVFTRESAIEFLHAGRKAIADNVCPDRGRGQPSTPECSPDVFFGYVCETAGIPVQTDLWEQYSQNSIDRPDYLDEARAAYRDGVSVIHGIKTKEQLLYVIG